MATRRRYTGEAYEEIVRNFAILASEFSIYEFYEMMEENPSLEWEDAVLALAEIVRARRASVIRKVDQ